MRPIRLLLVPAAAGVASAALVAGPAAASHSWGGYHWARTANPFTLTVGDNVSGAWDSVLATTVGDWSTSTVVDLTKAAGTAKGRCRATAGRVEVCNDTYGANGWLGVATVWVSGKHITQGTVKLNDTYFNTSAYNTTAWRNLVSCQEVGHTLGLDHQDENFDNAPLETCMDYTSDPAPNQHPNTHDYQELEAIYGHLDPTTTVGQAATGAAAAGGANSQADWGTALRYDGAGRPTLFVRDLGADQAVFTFVTWA